MDNTVTRKIPQEELTRFAQLRDEKSIREWHFKFTPFLPTYVIDRCIADYKASG